MIKCFEVNNLLDTFFSTVPEVAPTLIRGYPLNSTTVHVSWNGLPPSRHKEQLLGYRVRCRRLGSLLYKEENTTSNVTEVVVLNLVAKTKYEIEINGFNEIGHGPTSKTLVIKTLSYGKSEMTVLFHVDYQNLCYTHILSVFTNLTSPIPFYSTLTSSSSPVDIFV